MASPGWTSSHADQTPAAGPGWVFLSHNSLDKPLVERLAYELLDRGVDVWLDKWRLVAGRPWLEGVAAAIESASATVVCYGEKGSGRVQTREADVALNRAFQDPSRAVIPVLLPGGPEPAALPPFLSARTVVDLRQDSAWSTGIEQLCLAIEGKPAGPGARTRGECPYRGLESFDEQHAQWFFGRAQETRRLLDLLREQRLLTVTGASGCGKSSLVRAGIVPAVRTGELDGRTDWTVLTMRPKARPVHELALVMLTSARRPEGMALPQLREALMARPDTFSDEIDLWSRSRGEDAQLLLVVDQLEELFTQKSSPEEQGAFSSNILTAVTTPGSRCRIVTTLRADFLGACLASSALEPHIRASLAIARPMDEASLREVIVRPARQARVALEEGLADNLVESMLTQPGDLPLLSFALQAMWVGPNGNPSMPREAELKWADLEKVGGLKGAIAGKADELLEACTDEQQHVVRSLFGRMVQLGKGAPDTRKRVARAHLDAVAPGAAGLLDRFIDARLVTASAPLGDADQAEGPSTEETLTEVEPAHDALIREWGALKQWVDASREALRLSQDVGRSARRWVDGNRDEGFLLRGGFLQRVQELVGRGEVQVVGDEEELLEASVAAREALLEAERRSVRLRAGIAGLAVLLVVAVGATAAAVHQQRMASRRLSNAIEVAEFINFTVEGELGTVAGVSGLRKKLLDAAGKLLDELDESGRRGAAAQRARMNTHRIRGDLALRVDNLEVALREYREALRIAEALAESDPSNAVATRDLFVSYDKLGDVAQAGGDLAAARDLFSESFVLAKSLAESDPSNAVAKRDLAISYEKLGDVAQAGGDLAAARDFFSRGLELRKALAEADPSNAQARRDLSISYEKLGDVAQAGGDLAEALDFFSKDLHLAEVLVEHDPSNAQAMRDLSISYDKLGDVVQAGGDLAGARGFFSKGLELRKALAEDDPSNAVAKRDLSVSYNKLGDVAQAGGALAAARDFFSKGLELRKALAESDPSNAQARKDLLLSYGRLVLVSDAAKNARASLMYRRRARDVLAQLEARHEFSGDPQLKDVKAMLAEQR